ncbi:hypothetical protein [Pseudaminobacter soli (ex Zhang et al. 2022)]|uniref:hypothetical protein n=1 Tax=Pseudaminobacter soli (ex Zhang et al. 2022) TaxID=2831468 RepID=UPI001F1A59A0|nr:hypothetical protein [Pseudaminobacter soli]
MRHITVETGTKGLVSTPVSVINAAGEDLVCNADLAHWYSAEVGRAPIGGAAKLDLWFKPDSGAYFVLNDKQENMPVEALWCGIAGRAYETRFLLPLARHKGAEAAARAITCTDAQGVLACG